MVHYSRFEPKPRNRRDNHTVPSAAQLRSFRGGSHIRYKAQVTGGFTGTTDEIIQWAAWKWGINVNVLRAVAATESTWREYFVADGKFYGITQIAKRDYASAFPMAADSTAFNLDMYGAIFRQCYNGQTAYLGFHRGNMWGCVGAWYSGDWWSSAARGYVAKVKRALRQRVWLGRYF